MSFISLKLVISALLFIFSSGILYSKRFRDHIVLATIAGIVALVASVFVFIEIEKLVRGAPNSESGPPAATFATLTIAERNAELPEGNSGTKNFTFLVTRGGDVRPEISVNWRVTGGQADASDFGGRLPSDELVIPAGRREGLIRVPVSGDRDQEPDEYFTVELSNPIPSRTHIVTPTARGIIRNDDEAETPAKPPDARPSGGQMRPDLVVRSLSVAGSIVSPGAALDVKALIRNNGSAVAPGTSSGNGYMVDITLGTDTNTPPGYAEYSPNYSEDVLLKGGRFSNTIDLAPGAMNSYGDVNQVPTDTPSGKYYVCARVDPGGKVAESNERNNTRCVRITVRRRTDLSGSREIEVRCPELPAPRHIAPRNGSKLSHFPRTTRFKWSEVRNARTYGIEVDCLHCCVQGEWCSDVGQTWHVMNGLTSPKHVHNFIGAQRGRWRVWAVNECGSSGKRSGWWNFLFTR